MIVIYAPYKKMYYLYFKPVILNWWRLRAQIIFPIMKSWPKYITARKEIIEFRNQIVCPAK